MTYGLKIKMLHSLLLLHNNDYKIAKSLFWDPKTLFRRKFFFFFFIAVVETGLTIGISTAYVKKKLYLVCLQARDVFFHLVIWELKPIVDI